MMKNTEGLPLVSIIIPVYNSQDYLKVCINSVENQSYSNLEIICVNDGSNDSSEAIIRTLMLDDDRIKLINIDNHGQGYARNLGLSVSQGRYILFLDSDDFIEPKTIELTVYRAEKDKSDFVVFDYRYYKILDKKYMYTVENSYFKNSLLKDDECYELLKMKTLYTVNKLYRKEFLDKHNIRYLEGYFYEDIIFMVKNILCAKVVSLLSAPLYRISINKDSVTKTRHDTDVHSKSFIVALKDVVSFINGKNVQDERIYFLYLNLFLKFTIYYDSRVPEKFKNDFVRNFLNVFSHIKIPKDFKKSKFFSLCLENNWWNGNNIIFFRLLIFYSTRLKPYKSRVIKKMRFEFKSIAKKILRRLKLYRNNNLYLTECAKPLYRDVVLFYGFDNRYTGNSRYLFEEMLNLGSREKKLFFITDSPLVPLEYRIKPNSARAERFLARARTVVFESWIPLKYKKRGGTNWIQLWHGTPLKRMLFDSNEKYIVSKYPKHKKNKFDDISRWDYLITDNSKVNRLFNTAFLFNEDKMISCGYPRVRWLLDKKHNVEYKRNLRKLLGISTEKKIVLYVPTWRDYNYGRTEKDYNLNYLINLADLQEKLGSDFEVVYKDHPFISSPQSINFKNYCDAETQELLLIADYLITDYSSVLFDALAIDLPFLLYCNDFALNEDARGVYEDIWSDLERYVCKNTEEVCWLLNNYEVDKHYKYLKDKYSYKEQEEFTLAKFVRDL